VTYAIESISGDLLRYTRSQDEGGAWERFADAERAGVAVVPLFRVIAECAGYRVVPYRPLPNEYAE